MNKKEIEWFAVYLYYFDSLDDLLKKSVFPLIEILKKKNAFEQFFFIRYYERGKHIRLRFKTESSLADDVIKPFLIEYYNNYFKLNSSESTEPDWARNLPANQKWLPNNSIQFFNYEPETVRYGGPAGMIISEEHFQICSEAVLSALNECHEWSYSKAMGLAIQLMISFCFTAGMNTDQMIDFFSGYCNKYIETVINSYFASEKNDNNSDFRSKLLKIYQEKFTNQKILYTRLHSDLLESLNSKYDFEEDWFNLWILKNKNISIRLNETLDKGELLIPENFVSFIESGSENIYKLFYLYFSYMHMTYNRLGLDNKDEPYLCFIIKESLKNIKNNSL